MYAVKFTAWLLPGGSVVSTWINKNGNGGLCTPCRNAVREIPRYNAPIPSSFTTV